MLRQLQMIFCSWDQAIKSKLFRTNLHRSPCTLSSKPSNPALIWFTFVKTNQTNHESARSFLNDIHFIKLFIGSTSWSKVIQLRQDVVSCNGLQGHSVSWMFSDRQYRGGSCSGGSLHVFELLAFPESSCHSWGRETSRHVLAISSRLQAHSGPLWTEHQISDQICKNTSTR